MTPTTGTFERIRGDARARPPPRCCTRSTIIRRPVRSARRRSRSSISALRRRGFGPYGKASGVAEVDDASTLGNEVEERAHDRESAEPAVEHADGTRRRTLRSCTLAATSRLPGSGARPRAEHDRATAAPRPSDERRAHDEHHVEVRRVGLAQPRRTAPARTPRRHAARRARRAAREDRRHRAEARASGTAPVARSSRSFARPRRSVDDFDRGSGA